MFHILNYYVAGGINDSNIDMAATVDPTFTRRGGSSGTQHFIFTDDLQLMVAAYFAAHAKSVRANIPTWNAVARYQVWPLNESQNVPSLPNIMDLRKQRLTFPKYEEIAWEESNTLGSATEDSNLFLFLADPSHNYMLPTGMLELTVNFTMAPTVVQNGWTTDQALTFTENLRGGTYAVVDCEVYDPGLLAFRMNFPRGPISSTGRKFFPGALAENAIGNIPAPYVPRGLGQWGQFHSFEPPVIALYYNSSVSGAKTPTGKMDLVYLGPNVMPYQIGA